MAAALRCRGVDPCRTQIIAHSLGTIAAAQAAVCLSDLGPFAQLTLLDPPESMHEEIFDELCITAPRPLRGKLLGAGHGGYGAHVSRPGVQNYIVRGPHPVIGIVDLSRSNHVLRHAVVLRDDPLPEMHCGFQNSVFVHCCGRGFPEAPIEPPVELEPEPAIETALRLPDYVVAPGMLLLK